jgi:excisionase family DNA binding protein
MSTLVVIESAELEKLVESAVVKAVSKIHPVEPKEVLTLDQAAVFLERHPKVVMRLVKEAKLPVHYISGREPRFRRAELLAWVDALPTKPQEKDL